MTDDEIIQLACDCFGGTIKEEERENFIRFVYLAIEKEREEFAHAAVMFARTAIRLEREACAQICDEFSDLNRHEGKITDNYHAIMIRARSQDVH